MKPLMPAPKPMPRERTRKPLQRGKRINPRNDERAAKRWADAFHSDAYLAWLRTACACVITGSGGTASDPIVAAHIRSRGAGGKWSDVVPMLQSKHDEQHRIGIRSFEQRYSVDLRLVAAAHVQRWRAFAGEG